MTARQPKTNDYDRVHVQFRLEDRDQIKVAAARNNVSMSLFVARAAYEHALKVLGEDPPAPSIQEALDAILEQLALIETLSKGDVR